MHFSRVNLPSTNILTKSNLNNDFIAYWKLLNDRTDVSTKIIEGFDKPEAIDNGFLKKNTEYILDERLQDDDRYNLFLNSVVPSTKNLLSK